MRLAPSPLESDRFGVSIARADLVEPLAPGDELQFIDYDVVILRAPASMAGLSAQLATVPGRTSIMADHLCYWEWSSNTVPDVASDGGLNVRSSVAIDELMDLVEVTFDGYRNHYAANPLLDHRLVVPGYQEWCRRLIEVDGATTVVLDDEFGNACGFGIVDWIPDTPDVRLAGMVASAQGRGLYKHVIVGVMREVRDHERDGFRISTQSDNIRVMRAWTRLGLLPESTIATYHIVRTDLLGE